jgi:hypothetical protein
LPCLSGRLRCSRSFYSCCGLRRNSEAINERSSMHLVRGLSSPPSDARAIICIPTDQTVKRSSRWCRTRSKTRTIAAGAHIVRVFAPSCCSSLVAQSAPYPSMITTQSVYRGPNISAASAFGTTTAAPSHDCAPSVLYLSEMQRGLVVMWGSVLLRRRCSRATACTTTETR